MAARKKAKKRSKPAATKRKAKSSVKRKAKPAARKKKKAPARKAASAAARKAKRAVPGPKKSAKPNPALKKFSAAIQKDAALREQLLAPMTNTEFHKKTVALGAERGLRFTVAESKWHVAETKRLASSLPPSPSPWDQANPGHG